MCNKKYPTPTEQVMTHHGEVMGTSMLRAVRAAPYNNLGGPLPFRLSRVNLESSPGRGNISASRVAFSAFACMTYSWCTMQTLRSARVFAYLQKQVDVSIARIWYLVKCAPAPSNRITQWLFKHGLSLKGQTGFCNLIMMHFERHFHFSIYIQPLSTQQFLKLQQCCLHRKENYHQPLQHQVDVCNFWWSILGSLLLHHKALHLSRALPTASPGILTLPAARAARTQNTMPHKHPS